MSIDITAYIGIGWVVSQEQKEKMLEAAKESDIYDEVEDSFRYINSYIGNSDVFFGDFIVDVDAGDYIDLQSFTKDISYKAFLHSFRKILIACGQELKLEEEWSNPRLYLINQIW